MSTNFRHTKWQATLTPGRAANTPPCDAVLRTPGNVWIDEDSAAMPTATFDNIYIVANELSAERFGFLLFDLWMNTAGIGRFIQWEGERAQPFSEAQAFRLLQHLDSIVTFQFGYEDEDAVDPERNYNRVLQWLRRSSKSTSQRMDVPQLNLSIESPRGAA